MYIYTPTSGNELTMGGGIIYHRQCEWQINRMCGLNKFIQKVYTESEVRKFIHVFICSLLSIAMGYN